MYIVFLKFGPNRAQARQWMTGHGEWIQRGMDDGTFLLAGSLDDAQGGALLATSETREALLARIQKDPFVAHGVVTAEVHHVTPSRIAAGLAGLLRQTVASPATT